MWTKDWGQVKRIGCSLRASDGARKGRTAMRKVALVVVAALAAWLISEAGTAAPLREPRACGLMPWHRSLRDVNLANGNLFKSFTDIQVAPGAGAGLALQRTYNSNDSREGPFGVGWTHAYDIRMEEASPCERGTHAVRTDFFGGKHEYEREADGIYKPPPYKHSVAATEGSFYHAESARETITADQETDLNGTTKYFETVDGERVCRYIQDRAGNRTEFTYGQTIQRWRTRWNPSSSQCETVLVAQQALSQVTSRPVGGYDPRSIDFTWANVGTVEAPHWRITSAAGPLQTVQYTYYTPGSTGYTEDNAFQLQAVVLDPQGLARTTTFDYTHVTRIDEIGDPPQYIEVPERYLLSRVTDPLGFSQTYGYVDPENPPGVVSDIHVKTITEPGDVDQDVATQKYWDLEWRLQYDYYSGGDCSPGSSCWVWNNAKVQAKAGFDWLGRAISLFPYDATVSGTDGALGGHRTAYADIDDPPHGIRWSFDVANAVQWNVMAVPPDGFTPHGVATHTDYNETGQPVAQSFVGFEDYVTATEYWGGEKDFQAKQTTDARGYTTGYDFYPVRPEAVGYAGDGAAGKPWTTTDALGRVRTFTYTAAGQKETETRPGPASPVVTRYYYDYEDDPWGDLTKVVQDWAEPPGAHLTRTTTMGYDEAGRLKWVRTPKNQGTARKVEYTYNGVGELTDVTVPASYDPSGLIMTFGPQYLHYTYGGNGRIEGISSVRGSTSVEINLGYNANSGRLASVTETINGGTPRTVTYTYGRLGERRTVTMPDGLVLTYHYRKNGFPGVNSVEYRSCLPKDDPNSLTPILESITTNTGLAVWYEQDTSGKVWQVTANEQYITVDNEPARVAYQQTAYHPEYVLKSTSLYCGNPNAQYAFARGLISTVESTWNTRTYDPSTGFSDYVPSLLARNDYLYDEVGNAYENTLTDPLQAAARTETYGYDEMNRLESVDYGELNSQASWSYDVADNRSQQQTTVYDALNRLVTYNGQTVGYDAPLGGSIVLNDGSGRVNVWDDQNRLMETTRQGVTHSFLYGPDGLRRTATTGGVTTQYILDGQNVVEEMSPSGLVSYLWGPRGPEARIAPDESVLWYLYDKHGNVLGEVDANGVTNPNSQGARTQLRNYDVWGGVRNAGEVADNGNTLKYCGALGHPSENTTNLIYMRARYYDPVLGRFISEDSAKDGANWFLYAGGNPVGMVDADGRFSLPEVQTAVAYTGALANGGFNFLSYMSKAQDIGDVGKALAMTVAGGVGGYYSGSSRAAATISSGVQSLVASLMD